MGANAMVTSCVTAGCGALLTLPHLVRSRRRNGTDGCPRCAATRLHARRFGNRQLRLLMELARGEATLLETGANVESYTASLASDANKATALQRAYEGAQEALERG